MDGDFDPKAEGQKLVNLAETALTADRNYDRDQDNAVYVQAENETHDRFFDELNSLSYERLTAVADVDKRIHLVVVPKGTGTKDFQTANDCLSSVYVDAFKGKKESGIVSEDIIKCAPTK